MLEKILVPIDGSELATVILPFVAQFANNQHSTVNLLAVIDPDAVDIYSHPAVEVTRRGPADRDLHEESWRAGIPTTTLESGGSSQHEPGSPYASQVFERAEEKIRKSLEDSLHFLVKAGVDAELSVGYGNVAEEIVRTAEKEDFGLIAMSTHGRNVLGRGVLGSVTDAVVHSTCVPVLTLRPEEGQLLIEPEPDIHTAIVPLDGTSLAESVLPYIEELASKLSLEIILVRVVEDEGMRESADRYLEEIDDNLATEEVRRMVLRGSPSNSITDLASQTPNSIVALATHGRSGITRWIRGSVAEEVVRSSGCPVLITCGE